MRHVFSQRSWIVTGLVALPMVSAHAQTLGSSASSQTEPSKAETLSSSGGADPVAVHADIDDRFSTEGYVGVYGSLLQSTVPSVGITGSIFLDDDFRAGVDLWRGYSKILFSSFETQGAGLWGAWELSNQFWLKGGFSYTRLDRPTSQEPMSALIKSKDTTDPRPVRTDTLQADVSVGQLWNFSNFSLSADYLGFSLPIMTLTGPKPSLFNIHALRVEVLYDIE